MPARPLAAVPNIFAAEGTGSPNNIPLLDADFAALVSQTNDSSIGYVNYAADTGTANTYVVTLTSPPSGYVAGMTVAMVPLNTNTGASSINVSSLGTVNIVSSSGAALTGGEITTGSLISMVFDGISFRIQDSFQAVSKQLGAVSTNQTVACLGASSVSASMSTSTSNLNLTLQNIGVAVPVSLYVTNTSGGNIQFFILATSSSGSALTVQGINATVSGALIILSSTGATLGAGGTAIFTGSTTGSVVFFVYA